MRKIIIAAAAAAMIAVSVHAAETDTAAVKEEHTQTAEANIDTSAAPDTAGVAHETAAVALDTASAAYDTADIALDTVTVAYDTTVPPVAEAGAIHSDAKPSAPRAGYLFSLRPELMLVHKDIYSVGGIAEAGAVFENGLYLSLDFGCGANYAGGGFNAGYLFGSRGAGVKSAVGYSIGYYNTDIVVKFKSEDGEPLRRFTGGNAGVTGLFVKIMGELPASGKDGHAIDATGRVMTGYKSGSVWYNETDGIYTENEFTVSYSVSLGYTFIRRKR